jgi:thiamine phosphate synthase YjbQ (UPF0047 family)
MKPYTEYIWMNTKDRYAIVNITDEVEAAVKKSGVKEGLCLVNAMHITASVFTHDENSMQVSEV